MDGEDLKQQWGNLIFYKKYVSEIHFYSYYHIEHNGENKILNGYHENKILNRYQISKINHFKVLLLCKMMWHGYWRGITWLNIDVDTLHTIRFDLNDL
jgi:hypothetical protein